MHVQVHLEAAGRTDWTVIHFMLHKAEDKLSSAHNTAEALFSGLHMAVPVNRF
jgi:hypothetical protein